MPAIALGQTAAELIAAVSDRYEELEKACSVTVTLQQSNRNSYREGGFELTLNGDQARLVALNNSKPITWTLDQQFASFSNPALKIDQQFERDAPEANKTRDTIAEKKELLVGRFIKLNDLHTTLTVNGEQNLRTGQVIHHCLRIKIEPQFQDATEEIWVEPSTHLIWKSVKRWKGTARDQTIVWHKIAVGP